MMTDCALYDQDATVCVVPPPVDATGFASLAVPVHRASTIPFEDAAAYQNRRKRAPDGYSYGLNGTPTTRALEGQITELEAGAHTVLLPSGQAGIMASMLTTLGAGDHVLLPDCVYPPVREFARNELARFGIASDFYLPTSLEDLRARVRPETKLVWLESPGSTTMEIQDFAAVARIAHEHGALVGADNTWATPLNFKPIQHGADIVVEALTKYFGGHSDLLMGSVTTSTVELGHAVRRIANRFGLGVSPDDCSLVLRGTQTMALRLRHASSVSLRLASFAEAHAAVARVLHPALPSAPGHEIWKRDFVGASGVFSIVLTDVASHYLNAALDGLRTFAIGASWGGTRSLVAPMEIAPARSLRAADLPDLHLRISVGLESEAELLADLSRLLDDLVARARAA